MSEVRLSKLIGPAFYTIARDVLAHGHTHYDLSGGRGSLKSSFVSIIVPLILIQHPDAHALVLRKVANTIRDSVYTQYLWAIGELGMAHLWKAQRTPMELIYKPTGQKIMFRGADDPMKIKSIKVPFGYIAVTHFEEKDQFSGRQEIRTILQSTMRGGSRYWNFESYNPPISLDNWANKDTLEVRDDRFCHKSTYLEAPPEWLGEQFLVEAEHLKETNERAYIHEYLGEPVGTGGQVFDNLQLRKITDDELQTLSRFYNGLDFGFANDPDALTRWAYSPATRTLYAVREFVATHNSVDALAERIRAICGGEIVWSDSEDARTIAELKRRGINSIGVRKGPGSVRAGIKWLQDLAAIVIDPARTPAIAEEFSVYEYVKDRTGAFLPDVPDKNNHTIDSSRYAMSQLIQQKLARTRSDLA